MEQPSNHDGHQHAGLDVAPQPKSKSWFSRKPRNTSTANVSKGMSVKTAEVTPIRENPNDFTKIFSWMRRRTTLTLMVLFLILALIFAIGHFVFFNYLDNTKTEDRHIRQSHVTAISLLLTTAFKACMVAAVGLSFAQHLWRCLRQKTLAISRIEQLFCLRSNPFELTRARAAIDVPFLFAMAIFVWLIPIAVIYPPSALTVNSQPYSVTRDLNLPSLFPPLPELSNETIGNDQAQLSVIEWRNKVSSKGVKDNSVIVGYTRPTKPLIWLSRSTLTAGAIADFKTTTGENSSYALNFRSPQLTCTKSTVDFNQIDGAITSSGITTFQMQWSFYDKAPKFTIMTLETLRFYPYSFLPWMSAKNATTTYEGNASMITCEPVSVMYDVRISYNKGQRKIVYTTSDPKPLTLQDADPFLTSPISSWADIRNDTDEYKKWAADIQSKRDEWNQWALLDVVGRAMKFSCTPSGESGKKTTLKAKNGTMVPGYEYNPEGCNNSGQVRASSNFWNTLSYLDLSAFNPQRQNSSNPNWEFDPRTYNYSETMINEYISNVTLSALNLGLGTQLTPVNVTEYKTTYEFSAPINLILPYALSLFFGIIFVIVGIWSMVQNGTSAADGGFLQIMTSTVGRTEMEDLAVAHQAKMDGDDVPKDLLKLKIRYGELIDGEGMGTGLAGFGTENETNVLRKGWRSGMSPI